MRGRIDGVRAAEDAVLLSRQVRTLDVGLLDVDLAAVLLDQLEPPVVADRVGDPGPHHVRHDAHRHRRPERVVAVRDVDPGEDHRRLGGDRDARRLRHHQQGDAGKTEVADGIAGKGPEPVGH